MAKEKNGHMKMHGSEGKAHGKKSTSYESAAGNPTHSNGLPYGSYCGQWPEKAMKPGAAYPDGAGAIEGIHEVMHAKMAKQVSDKLY